MYKPMRKLEGIDATIIEHSVYQGEELVTFVIRAPKFLDAEIEKHRMFSSNSTSDRAIPFDKMKEAEFFIPNDIRKNQKGMQGFEQVDDSTKAKYRYNMEVLRNEVIDTLSWFPEIHKQHLNRYLLPWAYQTKIITTNVCWFNYFESLRDHPAADPAIQELATKMREAYTWSQPQVLEHTAWHLPFVTEAEWDNAYLSVEDLIKHSVARCARVSYGNHDGSVSSLAKDYELYELLKQHSHLTPMEHQATPMKLLVNTGYWEAGVSHMTRDGTLYSGNFKGFIQYRKLIEEKNNA